MAAEYEVNIKLNTKQLNDELKTIDTTIKNLGKTAKASENTVDKRTAAMVKLRNVGDQVRELENKGLNVSKARFQVTQAEKALSKGLFLTANQRLGIAVKEANAQKQITKELERQQKAQARQKNRRLGDIALGAGFPLLFGGGPGSVLGGALGGALGGGLAGQIGLSALGQQIDQLVGSAFNAAKAVTSVDGAFGMMTEKSLFSSDAMQVRIDKLIEEGKVAEAAALMTQEMALVVGGAGVDALTNLGKEAKEMTKQFNILITRIQAFLAQALAPFIKAINSVIGDINVQSQFAQLRQEASPDQLKQINEFMKSRLGKTSGRTQRLDAMSDALQQFASSVFPAAVSESGGIQPTQLETLRAASIGSGKALREEQRLTERLKKMDLERKRILEISRIKERIAEAERAGDSQLAVRLKGEQKIAEIESRRKQSLIGVTEQREIDQININAAASKLAAVRDTEQKIADVNKNDKTKEYKKQFELAQKLAKLQEEELQKQLKLVEQLGSTFKSGFVDGIKSAINGTKTLSEVLSSMLARLGDQLLNLGVDGLFGSAQQGTGLLGAIGGLFGGGSVTGPITGVAQSSFNATSLFTGAAIPFASGGYISSPTRALVGEGGQGEYVIPESKMRESMARYSRGARGASVIPESSEAGTVGDGGGTAVAAPIDVRYTVERINDVEYVTAAQFQAGMQQAAAQGAQRGEQQTLRRLQMSGSTRRRIGL